MRCLRSGFEATLKRKSANAVPVQRILCESQQMPRLCTDLSDFSGKGADPLWDAGKTCIFIESERFTPTGASFVRKPARWGALK